MMPMKKNDEKKIDKTQESQQPSSSKGVKRKIGEEEKGSEYLRRKHNFIKSTIRTDYQPDICKDYKETGFCGFGDSCKFLHDRTDYKHGWQLDQEWAKGQYKEEDDDKYLIKEDDDDEIDGILLNCNICKEPYKNPIVTRCKHYFCIECAEKECTDKCFTCEQVTSGIFKNAKKIIDEKISDRNLKASNAGEVLDSDDLQDDSESESRKSPEKTKKREDESSDLSDYYD